MAKRTVEVFTANCPFCDDAVKLVQELACENCDVQIHDLSGKPESDAVVRKARQYGVSRVPAVVINGELCGCCKNQEPITREALVAAGIGKG